MSEHSDKLQKDLETVLSTWEGKNTLNEAVKALLQYDKITVDYVAKALSPQFQETANNLSKQRLEFATTFTSLARNNITPAQFQQVKSVIANNTVQRATQVFEDQVKAVATRAQASTDSGIRQQAEKLSSLNTKIAQANPTDKKTLQAERSTLLQSLSQAPDLAPLTQQVQAAAKEVRTALAQQKVETTKAQVFDKINAAAAGVPGTTPAVPGTTPAVPGTTPAVPGTTPAVPGATPAALTSQAKASADFLKAAATQFKTPTQANSTALMQATAGLLSAGVITEEETSTLLGKSASSAISLSKSSTTLEKLVAKGQGLDLAQGMVDELSPKEQAKTITTEEQGILTAASTLLKAAEAQKADPTKSTTEEQAAFLNLVPKTAQAQVLQTREKVKALQKAQQTFRESQTPKTQQALDAVDLEANDFYNASPAVPTPPAENIVAEQSGRQIIADMLSRKAQRSSVKGALNLIRGDKVEIIQRVLAAAKDNGSKEVQKELQANIEKEQVVARAAAEAFLKQDQGSVKAEMLNLELAKENTNKSILKAVSLIKTQNKQEGKALVRLSQQEALINRMGSQGAGTLTAEEQRTQDSRTFRGSGTVDIREFKNSGQVAIDEFKGQTDIEGGVLEEGYKIVNKLGSTGRSKEKGALARRKRRQGAIAAREEADPERKAKEREIDGIQTTRDKIEEQEKIIKEGKDALDEIDKGPESEEVKAAQKEKVQAEINKAEQEKAIITKQLIDDRIAERNLSFGRGGGSNKLLSTKQQRDEAGANLKGSTLDSLRGIGDIETSASDMLSTVKIEELMRKIEEWLK
jgi:hypothetical protein